MKCWNLNNTFSISSLLTDLVIVLADRARQLCLCQAAVQHLTHQVSKAHLFSALLLRVSGNIRICAQIVYAQICSYFNSPPRINKKALKKNQCRIKISGMKAVVFLAIIVIKRPVLYLNEIEAKFLVMSKQCRILTAYWGAHSGMVISYWILLQRVIRSWQLLGPL